MSPHPGLWLLCRMVTWRGLIGIKGQVLPKAQIERDPGTRNSNVRCVTPNYQSSFATALLEHSCHGAVTVQPWASAHPQPPKTSLPGRGAEPSVPAFPFSPWSRLSQRSLGSSCCSESSQHPPDSAKLRVALPGTRLQLGFSLTAAVPAAAPADLLSRAAGGCPHGGDSGGSWSPPCPCSQNHLDWLPPCREGKQGPFPEGTAGSSEVPSTCWPPAVLWGEQVPHVLLLQERVCVVPRSPCGQCQGRLCPTAPWETTQHSQQIPVLLKNLCSAGERCVSSGISGEKKK